ncbi:Isochorismatase hydrolase [Viridothelium virens]|uniref:Isochorismatase hydrolase n=1 Tax=Viridothelium virens TaxID=1048519 RepID=A0A6A6HNB9_VIRVR|nr:Isochorismatase hydrolase [Viridothelium virens]
MTALAATFNAADVSAPGHYGPSQTALLLLDFHSIFVQKHGGSNAPAALEVATKMRTWAKSQDIQVIHCLIDLNATPSPTCKDADRLAGTVTALKSSGGEESIELIEGGGNDITFTRRPGCVSAMNSPGLDDHLQEKGIKSLVLTGLSTSGCVMRTALAASDAEYVVTVISDGCADRDQGLHQIILEKVLNNRGYVTTAAEIQEDFANFSNEKRD